MAIGAVIHLKFSCLVCDKKKVKIRGTKKNVSFQSEFILPIMSTLGTQSFSTANPVAYSKQYYGLNVIYPLYEDSICVN